MLVLEAQWLGLIAATAAPITTGEALAELDREHASRHTNDAAATAVIADMS